MKRLAPGSTAGRVFLAVVLGATTVVATGCNYSLRVIDEQAREDRAWRAIPSPIVARDGPVTPSSRPPTRPPRKVTAPPPTAPARRAPTRTAPARTAPVRTAQPQARSGLDLRPWLARPGVQLVAVEF